MTQKIERDAVSQEESKEVHVSKVDRDALVLKKKPSIEEMIQKVRKVYRPGNTVDAKLFVPDEVREEGYHYHFVNDKRSKIAEKMVLGYEPVTDLSGKVIRKVVNSSPNAEFREAVLMKIPQEVFDEIQRLRQAVTAADYKKVMTTSRGGTEDTRLGTVKFSEHVEN